MLVVHAERLVRAAGCKYELTLGPGGQFVIVVPATGQRYVLALLIFLEMEEKAFTTLLRQCLTLGIEA